MDQTNPTALALVVIGAIMGFAREPLTRVYAWLFERLRRVEASPRLLAITRLYLVFTSLIFTVAGMLGLLGVVHW
jgi:hypothetical protein